jgi:hypothetical protein
MSKTYFTITGDDIQEIAKQKLGRELDEFELDKIGNKINLYWTEEIDILIEVYIKLGEINEKQS